MSPAPAAAAAAKVAADKEANDRARQENDGELIATDIYERSEESLTTEKSGGGFSFGGGSDHEIQIVLLLVLAGVIIFIQHDKSGQAQSGVQFAALGVVGFVLLVIASFWPDVAFLFTILFVVAVILNSPNGIPIVGQNIVPNKPGEVGFGAAAPGTTVNQATGQANPKGK